MVGPLCEMVCEKLIHEFPFKFCRCLPDSRMGTLAEMEEGIQNGIFVDFRRRTSHFEVLTVNQVKDICDKVIFKNFSIKRGLIFCRASERQET